MAVIAKTFVEAKAAEASQTTQYTTPGNVTSIIDKFTATNFSAAAATISVNLVPSITTASSTNLITKSKTLQPSESYTFPELVGQILAPGDFISTLAGTSSSINIRVSGREITQ